MMKQLLALALILALLGIAVPVFGQSETPTPSPTPTALATEVATPDPDCELVPPTRLIVRERARVTLEDDRPLNIREEPTTTSSALGAIQPGQIVYVLDGPECSTIYAWYQIEYNGIIGWIAEGTDDLYFVEVYPPGE